MLLAKKDRSLRQRLHGKRIPMPELPKAAISLQALPL